MPQNALSASFPSASQAETVAVPRHQIAEATGTQEAKLRAEYREFAEGQHRLWAEDSLTGIRLGMDDAKYAEAIASAGDPVPAPESEPAITGIALASDLPPEPQAGLEAGQ